MKPKPKTNEKFGGSKSNEETSNKKEHGINHIDTEFLFNETTSEMKIFATANPHMAILDTGSPVNALRRTGLLSDLRTVDNELLVIGNNKGSKLRVSGIGSNEKCLSP